MSINYNEKTESKAKNRDQFFIRSGITRFGERLKQMMDARGIHSNVKMGALCDMSDTVIRNYMNGKTYPTIDRLATIAYELDCSPEWLLTGNGNNTRGDEHLVVGANIYSPDNELEYIVGRLKNEYKNALTDAILQHGVHGIINALAQYESESVSKFAQLSAEEKNRLLSLHDAYEEAKKGASDTCAENHVTNVTQKQAG